MIAVCLLTADRPNATAATLATFSAWNPGQDFLRLHADDGSATTENHHHAVSHRFRTVYATGARLGQMPALCAMWTLAEELGATWILHLENDQEWVAPMPDPAALPAADCIRLYGAMKARSGPKAPAGAHRIGTKQPILWTPAAPGWERGRAHWGGQPSITRADVLVDAAPSCPRMKDLSLLLTSLDTLRPVENITWHLDGPTTPDFGPA